MNDYVGRLARALGDVPAEVRRELVEDVRGYVEEAWAAAPQQDRAALLNILARLGEPEALAQEERERLGLTPPHPAGPDLLAAAAVVFTALFWPVGVILAWLSPRWSGRDKVVATLLPVLGLLLVLLSSFAAASAYSGSVPQPAQVATVEAEGTPSATSLAPAGAERENQRPGREQVQTQEDGTQEGIWPVPPPSVWASGLASAAAGALLVYLWIGAPLTAAAYLGLRLGRRRRAAWLLAGLAWRCLRSASFW